MKIYVVVYKEVTQTMSMSSSHTKVRRATSSYESSLAERMDMQHALEDLHPNIACMRHPDHIGSRGVFAR